MIHLSKRLQAICDMVEPGSRICDVGCDHAHVDIRLLQEGTVTDVLAMDVAKGPLERARENLELTGLSDQCTLRLSDGLAAYEPGEADVMICAGMGGGLMRRILGAEPDKAASFREMILSPHTEIALVREWLRCNGFRIVREEFLEEEGKYYTVMKASPGPGDVVRPDWDGLALAVDCLTDEELDAARVGRAQVLRLLMDSGFRQLAEDEYGPHILCRFLMKGTTGARTQETFLRFLTGRLRDLLERAQMLAGRQESRNAAMRLQQISGEIGILQVLLFLYRIRERM